MTCSKLHWRGITWLPYAIGSQCPPMESGPDIVPLTDSELIATFDHAGGVQSQPLQLSWVEKKWISISQDELPERNVIKVDDSLSDMYIKCIPRVNRPHIDLAKWRNWHHIMSSNKNITLKGFLFIHSRYLPQKTAVATLLFFFFFGIGT
jgi:hypothetical protein